MTVGGRLGLILILSTILGGCGRAASDKAACEAGLYAFKALAIPTEQHVRWTLETGGELPRFAAADKRDSAPPAFSQMPVPTTFWAAEGDGEVRPADATIRAFTRGKLQGVENCSSVRDAAKALSVLGPVQRGARKLGPDGLYEVSSVTMSRPVLSPNGNEALLYAAYSSGPLAASGMLYLLRRDAGGEWRVAGKIGLWIS